MTRRNLWRQYRRHHYSKSRAQIEEPDGKENENTSASQPYFSVSSNGKFCIIKQMEKGSLPLSTSIRSQMRTDTISQVQEPNHLMVKIDQITHSVAGDFDVCIYQLYGVAHCISCSGANSETRKVVSDLFNRIARRTGQI